MSWIESYKKVIEKKKTEENVISINIARRTIEISK